MRGWLHLQHVAGGPDVLGGLAPVEHAVHEGRGGAVESEPPGQTGSLSPSGGASTSKALTTPHSIAK